MNWHLFPWAKSLDMNSASEGWDSEGTLFSSFSSLDYVGKQRKIIKTMKTAALSNTEESQSLVPLNVSTRKCVCMSGGEGGVCGCSCM